MIDTITLRRLQDSVFTDTLEPQRDRSLRSTWTMVKGAVAVPRENPRSVLLDRYISRAMLRARTEWLPDDGLWFAAVPVIQDVWASGMTPEDSFEQLASVLRVWLEWKIEDKDEDIPSLDGIDPKML